MPDLWAHVNYIFYWTDSSQSDIYIRISDL